MRFAPGLLVTLELDDAGNAYFEELRQRFFPAGLNRVPAHVMLFHRLPLDRRSAIVQELRRVSSETEAFSVTVLAPYSLGTGASYALDSQQLLQLRRTLADVWSDVLIAQDREKYRPHVVVQNKVDHETVKRTLTDLADKARPSNVQATGITLWGYSSGVWKEPTRFPFKSD